MNHDDGGIGMPSDSQVSDVRPIFPFLPKHLAKFKPRTQVLFKSGTNPVLSEYQLIYLFLGYVLVLWKTNNYVTNFT